jgi:hypothetical protein
MPEDEQQDPLVEFKAAAIEEKVLATKLLSSGDLPNEELVRLRRKRQYWEERAGLPKMQVMY